MADLFDEAPDWLDSELWDDFIDHRTQIKKPLTEVAKKRLLRKLERWNASGVDINECLERSIINRWQDIYERKREPAAGTADEYIQELHARGYRLDLPPAAGPGSRRKH